MNRRTNAPQQLSKKRLILMGVVLLVAVTYGAEAVGRLLFASWSIGIGGRETMTGLWIGSLRTQHGAEHGLSLVLEYKDRPGPSYRSGGGALNIANLKGHATICTPKGDRYEYDVVGKADPFGGIEDLWLDYGDPSQSGLGLKLTGAWRDSALQLTVTKNPFLPDGRLLAARTSNTNEPLDPDDYFAPARFTDRNAGSFDVLCQRIRA